VVNAGGKVSWTHILPLFCRQASAEPVFKM
jgi:hypothetical protein